MDPLEKALRECIDRIENNLRQLTDRERLFADISIDVARRALDEEGDTPHGRST